MAETKVAGNRGLGRKKGVPNKFTGDLKSMILGALNEAGGQDYLSAQAQSQPVAFMALLGRVLPATLQHTGADGGAVEIALLTPQQRADRAQQMIEQAFAEVSRAAANDQKI